MTAPLAAYPGACDCHMHVFEERWPLAPTATFKPPHAPAADYLEVRRTLGFERTVVVQPTGYGLDNRCTLEAVAALGPEARAVVVVAHDESEAELARLHGLGARAVRFMMLPGGVLPWSALAPTAARIAPLGWNINLQLDGRELPQHEAALLALPTRLVIDHVGRFHGPTTPESPAFASLCRLIDGGRCWVKISAPYESSKLGPPDYADIAPLARTLAERYPERCLWATNWPHPNVVPRPVDTTMLDWTFALIVGESARRRILVDNAAEFYGF
jgi:D-galactarolactone isomerase